MNTETLDFSMWLTGHDKETIEQMWNDWKRGTKHYRCSRCGAEYTSSGAVGCCIMHQNNGRISLICGGELIEIK